MPFYRAYYHSPIGWIEIRGTDQSITAIEFSGRKAGRRTQTHPILAAAVRQLDEYFRGRRREFSLRLDLKGTDFQKRVWLELAKIPYGRTASYGQVAGAVGRPGAARAVGQANHHNPISIVIPCHRIIGAGGRLVGYGGGLWRKEWLLAHEMKLSGASKRR